MMQTTLEFSSRTENLAVMRAFVRKFLQGENIPERESELLVLGVDEACSNIIRHAYLGVPEQPIMLSCERFGATLRFRLRDFGISADPTQFKRRQQEQVEPGGLGLYLIARIFDEANFQPQPKGTELVLIKRLE